MAKTLRDLFNGSKWESDVKKETETFLEEELSGIRVKSLVDVNNPLIYGSEATRIALRTTPVLDDMKAAATGEQGDTGAIGGKITQLRDGVNDMLGIPETMIPTRVVEKMGTEKTAQEVMDEKNGTELGKLLKSSGGNPKTIATQAIGGAVELAKDKLRGVLFGNQNEPESKKSTSTYTDKSTYTDIMSSVEGTDSSYTEIHTKDDLLLDVEDSRKINLAEYSPIYGVDRKSDLWKTKLAQQVRANRWNHTPTGEYPETGPLSKFSSESPYSGIPGEAPNAQAEFAITNRKKGIGYLDTETKLFADALNEQPALIEDADTEKFEDMDLVPFWIGLKGAESRTHFRALLSGISETVSPSWDSSKFFGNPFSYYTYSSIERSVTFSLQIYCMSKDELLKNWKRIEQLTKYTYPRFENIKVGENSTELVKPPIIEFKLGDVYVNQVGFIDSLSYTFPDNGTWEIDKGNVKPKFIDVSVSIKFIEQPDILTNGLYGKTENVVSDYTMGSQTSDTVKPVKPTQRKPMKPIATESFNPGLASTTVLGR